MNLKCVDPCADLLWKAVVSQSTSSLFHSPSWIQVVAETYGWEAQAYVLLDDEGKPKAGIPFCRITDVVGERIVSLPFSDFCDPLVCNRDEWNTLIDALLAHNCPIAMRCVHNTLPLADGRLVHAKRAKWHGLDLQRDVDTIWQGLHNSAWRAIRKARQDGVVVRIAEQPEELRAFFDMHLRMRKYKYHLLAQPYRFFENIWRHFLARNNGVLMLALLHDEIIGGTLFLDWNSTLYYKFNASLPAHLGHRPNDLLAWEGIRYAKARGFTFLDFGLSDWDQEGLLRYKRKFASEEKTINFLRYNLDGASIQHEQEMRGLVSRLAQLFASDAVSDRVTAQAGELLYPYLT